MPEHVHLLLSEPQLESSPLKPKPGLNGPRVLLSEPRQDTLADALNIFTAIRSSAGYASVQRTGSGAAFATMQPALKGV